MATRKITPVIEHYDCLGRLLKVGDYVGAAQHNFLTIATINKCTPKMIVLSRVGARSGSSEFNKYPIDVVLLDGADVTFHLLQMAK